MELNSVNCANLDALFLVTGHVGKFIGICEIRRSVLEYS